MIVESLERAMNSPKFGAVKSHEIAFYGGTFTGLSIETMEDLLSAVHGYIRKGLFESVRVSTRPDALDSRKLDLMWHYGVRTVELGVQSLDKGVLEESRRGYTPERVREGVDELAQHGFRIGIQLMPGLPGDTREKFLRTVQEVVALKPAMVRLYPTVVVQGTGLAGQYRQGRYRPLGLQEAVDLCAESCIVLEENGIPVIRIGLQASPSLQEEGIIVAGPWHPAFGFLVRTEIYQRKLLELLFGKDRSRTLRIRVNPRDIPMVRGHRNHALEELIRKTGMETLEIVSDKTIEPQKPVVESLF
jgi:histone acetyltransferase (RNA polymerase elongator complex component)